MTADKVAAVLSLVTYLCALRALWLLAGLVQVVVAIALTILALAIAVSVA